MPSPREARSTGEMRGLTVVAGCNDYMDNRLEEVKRLTARQEVRAASAFGPLLAISLACHRLEGKAFCLFGKQNTSDSPRSCTGGKRYRDARAAIFGRSDRWEGTTGLKKNRARRDIPRLGSPTRPLSKRERCWPREACLTAVVKQLLDWIAELEGRPRPDKK